MSKQDYERVITELGGSEPKGRRFHAAYGDDQVQIFEVWDSHEQFQNDNEGFVAHLQSLQLGAGNVEVHPLHSDPPA
jgi:hypothetical protein